MKITFVSLWAHKLFYPDEPQPFGGAELQLKLLATALSTFPDTEVQFITRGEGPYAQLSFDDITIYKLPYRKSGVSRRFLGSFDLVKTLVRLDSDVVIQRGGGFETGMAAWATEWLRIPFIFMLSHIWDVDRTHEKKRGWLYGRIYMFGLKKAELVICQTIEQQWLLQENYRRESILQRSAHVIPEKLPAEKRGILWVGRCADFKRPQLLLELAERMPETSFTMICPQANSETLFNDVRNRANQLANVNFIPGVSFEETESYFASHRLYVSTSDKEGFPNTFIQSLKWGTPILTLDVDPDGILHKNAMGWCSNGSLEQLKEKALELLHDEQQWQDFSANARAYVREHHDIDVIAKAFYEMIKKIQ